MAKLKLKYFIYLFVPLVLLAGYFIPPSPSAHLVSEQQVWKHRQNTPADAIIAISEGYLGIEADITFLNDTLYVAHDETEYAQAVPLREYVARISATGATPYFWFDIKNISAFNEAQIRDQFLALNLDDRIIVESPRPMFMFRLCSSGLTCSVWADGSQHFVWRVWYRFWINLLSKTASVSMVSIDYRLAGIADEIVPRDFPKALYTFPKGTSLDAYASQKDFLLLLTD